MPYTGDSHKLGLVSMVVFSLNSHTERFSHNADRFSAGKTGIDGDLEVPLPCQAAFVAGCCKTVASERDACKLNPYVIKFTIGRFTPSPCVRYTKTRWTAVEDSPAGFCIPYICDISVLRYSHGI